MTIKFRMACITLALASINLGHAQSMILPNFECTMTNKLDNFNWPGVAQADFAHGDKKIYLICDSDNAVTGDSIKAVWIADHTNRLPPHYIIAVRNHRVYKPAHGDQISEANLSIVKPSCKWPAGVYHVQLYVNGIEDKSYPFIIK
jgi:hypothetical protein